MNQWPIKQVVHNQQQSIADDGKRNVIVNIGGRDDKNESEENERASEDGTTDGEGGAEDELIFNNKVCCHCFQKFTSKSKSQRH